MKEILFKDAGRKKQAKERPSAWLNPPESWVESMNLLARFSALLHQELLAVSHRGRKFPDYVLIFLHPNAYI